jgi:hypothetical protein
VPSEYADDRAKMSRSFDGPSERTVVLDAVARAEELVGEGALEQARGLLAPHAGDDAPAAVHNVLGVIAYHEHRLIDAQRELELACSRPDAGQDAVANLAHVRAELGGIYAQGPARSVVPDADADDRADAIGVSWSELMDHRLGDGPSTQLLGHLLSTDSDPDLDSVLTELPSATTVAERRMLQRYATVFWDGAGDVFENGPLLGGSTRALAIGMLRNPRRSADALLHTYDWFSNRVPLDLAPGTFERLLAEGRLTTAQYQASQALGSFKPVFDALHGGHDYSPLVRSHVGYLPGHRGELPAHGEPVFSAPQDRLFSLVFVDGCKSWYGTKYWLTELCHHIPVGTHFLFQDFGQYTCFWLPTLVGLLPDHFRIVAHVDHTYAFRLLSPITAELVESRFPDEPTEVSRATFDALFDTLLAQAGARGDMHGIAALATQRAAAYAYIGLVDEARAAIDGLLARPELIAERDYLLRARRSPTYRPEGPIML